MTYSELYKALRKINKHLIESYLIDCHGLDQDDLTWNCKDDMIVDIIARHCGIECLEYCEA